MHRWFSAPLAVAFVSGLVAPLASAQYPLADYKTENAKAAVKAYATAAGTKADADKLLDGVKDLVDVSKVKDGDGLEVKDGKAIWTPAVKKPPLADDDAKKVDEALEKLLAEALKAEKKLSAADAATLAKLSKGAAQGTQSAPAATLTAEKLDRATAAASLKAFFEQTPAPAELKPLDDAAKYLDVAAIKSSPNLSYDAKTKQLTWNLQYNLTGEDVLLSKENEKPEDDTKKEAERKKLKDSLRPLLKAALKAEKDRAKRLTDADLDKLTADAKLELRKQIGLTDFLASHLNKAVAAHLEKNKDAVKALDALVDTADLTQAVKADDLRVVQPQQRVEWVYKTVYRDGQFLSATEEQLIRRTLSGVLVDAARGYGPLSQEGQEEFEKLLKSVSSEKAPRFKQGVADKPFDTWETKHFRQSVKNLLNRVARSDPRNTSAIQTRESLISLGVAVASAGELDVLVDGLTYTKNGSPAFVWNYYPKKGQVLNDAARKDIRDRLLEVIEQALALPQEDNQKLSLKQEELEKKVKPLLKDKDKAKIEYKDLSSVANVNTLIVAQMLSGYLTQRNPDDDTRRQLADARRALGGVVEYDSLLTGVGMKFTPPEGQTAGKFAWAIPLPIGKKKPEGAGEKEVQTLLRRLLVDAARDPQGDLLSSMTEEAKRNLIDILDQADVTFKETELTNVYEALNLLQDRLKQAEDRIAELEGKAGVTAPPPPLPAGPQYQTFQVSVPCGLFGCRTRTATVTVPVR